MPQGASPALRLFRCLRSLPEHRFPGIHVLVRNHWPLSARALRRWHICPHREVLSACTGAVRAREGDPMPSISKTVAAVVTGAAIVVAVPAPAVAAANADGCVLSIIDAGRTAYANCKVAKARIHLTECSTGGGSVTVYVRPFKTSHYQYCPSGNRVRFHNVYLA